MRIISGTHKGRILKSPKGIRPTQDNAKKALFDILGDMNEIRFLELFAGSGSIGLEALSLGAREVVFAEKEQKCFDVIRENLELCKFSNSSIVRGDADLAIKRFRDKKNVFDIIFFDPPYYRELAKKTLQLLGAYDILAPNGFVIAQHFKKDLLPEISGFLKLFRQERYGDTVLSFYKRT
ncbi:MAG: 16S rRNA (guanine(966)-N(2))-methyltransferase RsmD [Candidatus Omnitrophica bacterium]|nr:16S rRNA (guanine(966)-N(2))-methyltransferase RsmD [Candidatus Omnitrophota bacterium]